MSKFWGGVARGRRSFCKFGMQILNPHIFPDFLSYVSFRDPADPKVTSLVSKLGKVKVK